MTGLPLAHVAGLGFKVHDRVQQHHFRLIQVHGPLPDAGGVNRPYLIHRFTRAARSTSVLAMPPKVF